MPKKLNNTAHVYFYALPNGAEFTWQGDRYKKIADADDLDNVEDSLTGKLTTFDAHYGCIISKQDADRFGIKKEDYRPL